LHEVEVRRRDDSAIILKRGVERDVVDAHSHPSARQGASTQLFAGDVGLMVIRLRRLTSRGPFGACAGTYAYAGQCRCVFQKPPAARSLGIHSLSPVILDCRAYPRRKYPCYSTSVDVSTK